MWQSLSLILYDSMMSMTGNTRPITSNTRGRIYRCGKCPHNPYQGERGKVFLHFYRKHVAMDQVPFFCCICIFDVAVGTREARRSKSKPRPSGHSKGDAGEGEGGGVFTSKHEVLCYHGCSKTLSGRK